MAPSPDENECVVELKSISRAIDYCMGALLVLVEAFSPESQRRQRRTTISENEAKQICGLQWACQELAYPGEAKRPEFSAVQSGLVTMFDICEASYHALAEALARAVVYRLVKTISPAGVKPWSDPAKCQLEEAVLMQADWKKVAEAIRHAPEKETLGAGKLLELGRHLEQEWARVFQATNAEGPPSFLATELQRNILKALTGRALTADGLQGVVACSRSTLYGGKSKTGGLKELVEQGLVANDRKIGGYYRPAFPPAQESN